MSFSADWLALRAQADRRARDGELATRAAALITREDRAARIVDVGSGTGATVRALAPRIARPQDWTLIDADADLLDEATRLTALDARANITITTLVEDLAKNPAPWSDTPDLVTASALFDLTSAEWIERFCDALATQKIPLYASLTFDGGLFVSPTHPFDRAMVEAFHTHQRTDKGFGPAAGPAAATTLAHMLASHGFRVDLAATPWHLTGMRDELCIASMLDGWAGAARELSLDEAAISQWRSFHNSVETMYVGHVDLLATPAS